MLIGKNFLYFGTSFLVTIFIASSIGSESLSFEPCRCSSAWTAAPSQWTFPEKQSTWLCSLMQFFPLFSVFLRGVVDNILLSSRRVVYSYLLPLLLLQGLFLLLEQHYCLLRRPKTLYIHHHFPHCLVQPRFYHVLGTIVSDFPCL